MLDDADRTARDDRGAPALRIDELADLIVGLSDQIGDGRNGELSAPAADHDTDKKGNSERLQGRLSRPESQAIQRRTGLSTCFYCVGNGLGRCFDRFRGGSDGVFRPVEFVRTVVRMKWLAFADHQISPAALETNGGMQVWFLAPLQAPTARRERLGFGRVGSLRGPASESPSGGFGR